MQSFVKKIFDIKDSSDVEKSISEISDNITIKGYNIWILICSALLASIGLDTNSTAVIIGAMLISPLMSPILGVGLAVEMFFLSIRNLIIATVLAFITATFYFFITPLGDVTSELLARTKPTLLDVGVAFFGGIAGIVASSRKDKTNAIPGVAIATALMPPLCTSGFGLATGDISIFLGGFYLFFINAVFISFATFLIVKYLKFPIRNYLDKAVQKKAARIIFAVLFIAVFPSIYFLYTVYEENTEKRLINRLISSEFSKNQIDVIKWNIIKTDSTKEIRFYISGIESMENEKAKIEAELPNYKLENYKIKLVSLNISKDDIERLKAGLSENILKSIEIQNAVKKEKNVDTIVENQLNNIVISGKKLFPELKINSIGNIFDYNDNGIISDTSLIIYVKSSNKDFNLFSKKFKEYIQLQLPNDSIIIKQIFN